MSAVKNDKLLPIFEGLKGMLAKYEPPLIAGRDEPGGYELLFDKDYQTRSARTGKTATKHGLYFAGVIIQKNYVGLYFMPVYSHAAEFAALSPRLRRTLKGKSCFYITELDDGLKAEVSDMLEKGYRLFDKFDGTAG